jgi:hypothetical protein
MRLRALSARFDFEGVEDFLVEVALFIQTHFVSKWGSTNLAQVAKDGLGSRRFSEGCRKGRATGKVQNRLLA